ncbi:MAG: hypothetical protein CR988_06845 [Treponema sp.]|nr:MAG: hypothetical protein CR988_06845 [Treponema sp.]
MKNNNIIFVLGLCPLIPCSANFASGLIMSIAVWFVFLSSLFSRNIIAMLKINKFSKIFTSIFVMASACIFDFFIRALFPFMEISIKFYILILTFSYIIILCVDTYFDRIESFEMPVLYSSILLGMSFIRELLAFGSISFPGSSALITLRIIPKNKEIPFRFFGSTAGAFIILGIACWVYFCITKAEILPFKRRTK